MTLRIVGGLLLLLVLVITGAVLSIDRIAASAVASGTTTALGVETRVDSAHVGLLSGAFGLSGLDVANPAGFEGPPFLSLREARLHVGLGTLLDELVVVPLFALDGLRLRLVSEDGRTNFGRILDHVRTQGGGAEAAESSAPAKRFVVEQVQIRDVVAHVTVRAGGRTLREVEVPVPEIRLENVGSESGGGVVLAQLSATLVQATLQAVARQGGQLPTELLAALRGDLRRLPSVSLGLIGAGSPDVEGAKQAADEARRLGEEAGGRLRDLGGRLLGREEE